MSQSMRDGERDEQRTGNEPAPPEPYEPDYGLREGDQPDTKD